MMKMINNVVRVVGEEDVAVIEIDAPPVNALSTPVRKGLIEAIDYVHETDVFLVMIILCRGRTFSVGADIAEFDKPRALPSLPAVMEKIERASKPVIAAIHGMALGGGLELAMAAHYRIATRSAKCGLPEVNLGILPGAGGTQRLPRLIGVQKALEFITSGKQFFAPQALEMGLFDELVEEDNLRAGAIMFARKVVDSGAPLRKISALTQQIDLVENKHNIFDAFRKNNARKFYGFLAPEYIIQAIEASVGLPFGQGLALERKLLNVLLDSPQSAAQRHVFFAERQAAKSHHVSPNTNIAPILKVGVIGAGTMGRGIAMNFLNIGLPVVIIDKDNTSLTRGRATIIKDYENSQKRGKITQSEIDGRMNLLRGSTELSDLADCNLIIEAAFENLAVKKDIFIQLDKIAKTGAILATNTSYLDVDEIASVTKRPEYVIGLHFFSPANIMRLLEIVRATKTNDVSLATAVDLAKRMGKVGVVVGNGYGFVGNRMLQARQGEAEKMILEGVAPWDVDRVLYDFGFPMGPFQMRDLVGLDVGWNKAETASRNVREILNEMGRHGQKNGAGFYDYDDQRNRSPSAITEKIIKDFAAKENVKQRHVIQIDIRDRMLFAMINEGAKILEDGIASCASDIDTMWVMGYGWPKYLGGPMYWADQLGLDKVVDRLVELETKYGEQFKPTQLIQNLATEGTSFREVMSNA